MDNKNIDFHLHSDEDAPPLFLVPYARYLQSGTKGEKGFG